MKLPHLFLILLAVGAPGLAQDAPQPADSKPAVEKPVAVQQQSVAAMQPSLAAQRASIASQVGDRSSGIVFPARAALPIRAGSRYGPRERLRTASGFPA